MSGFVMRLAMLGLFALIAFAIVSTGVLSSILTP